MRKGVDIHVLSDKIHFRYWKTEVGSHLCERCDVICIRWKWFAD